MQVKTIIPLFNNGEFLKDIENQNILNITCSSKEVQAGTIFFAIKGTVLSGHDFIAEAIEKKASIVIYEKKYNSDIVKKLELVELPNEYLYKNTYLLAVDDIKQYLIEITNLMYPNKPKHIIAVTGTSGKTSVAWFTNQLWQLLNKKSSFIGTLGVSALEENNGKSLTTPGLLDLFKILDKLKQQDIDHVIIEASSHGIEQNRLGNLILDAAAFTNFGRDHLDYHDTSENYFKAKMKLFKELLPTTSPAIIFSDDKYSEEVIENIKSFNQNILTVGLTGEFIKVLYKHETEFALRINNKLYTGSFLLPGKFQWHNIIMALAIVIANGADIQQAIDALKDIKPVPGRMQLIGKNINDASIYVDYAHKPEALESILQTLRPTTKGKIILVFGCGGNRDIGKRAIMGQIAQKLADIILITDDNPRYEDPSVIRKEILANAPKAIEVASRAEAIKKAIKMAQKEDTVIIAGKGHETGQQLGDKLKHFSDEEEVIKWIQNNE